MDLLLGCGYSRKRFISPDRSEWNKLYTVDINPDVKPDLEWDLNRIPLPFSENFADEIHAYNVLEHLGTQGDYKFMFAQFNDFWRILKPNGYLCAMVPSDNNVWTWGDPSHTRVINNGTITFFDQDSYKECENSMRTDYRYIYKGDFKIIVSKIDENGTYYFALQAKK